MGMKIWTRDLQHHTLYQQIPGTHKLTFSLQVELHISTHYCIRNNKSSLILTHVTIKKKLFVLFSMFVYSFFIEGNSTSVTSTAFQAGPHFTENNIYIIIIQYIQYFTIYMIVNLIHDIKNRFFLDENYKTILIKFVEVLI